MHAMVGLVERHVFAVTPVPVERQLASVDRPPLLEADPQVDILSHHERLVVEADLNQVLLAEHDSATDRVLEGVAMLEMLFALSDGDVVARDRAHVGVELEKKMQHVQEVVVHVIVGIDTHDEAGVGGADGTVDRGGKAKLPLVDEQLNPLPELLRDLAGRVGAAVVDEDDVVGIAREALMHDRPQRPLDEALLVVGSHDDGDVCHGNPAPGRHAHSRGWLTGGTPRVIHTLARVLDLPRPTIRAGLRGRVFETVDRTWRRARDMVLLRRSPELTLIAAVYALLKVWSFVGASAVRTPDSGTYVNLSTTSLFDAQFYSADRPFVLPLLYKIFASDEARIVAQWSISSISWLVLTAVVAQGLANRTLKAAAFGLILAFGLTTQVSSWDGVIVSESLSLSLGALVLAAAIKLARRPGWGVAAILICLSSLWVFTRDANAFVVPFLSIPVALVVWRLGARRVAIAVTVAVCVLIPLSNASVNAGERWIFPFMNVVGQRILPNDDARWYFARHGMPVTPEILALTGEPASGKDYALYRVPGLLPWVKRSGRSTYAQYLLTHPQYTARGLWDQRNYLFAPELGTELPPSGSRPALPDYLNSFLYPRDTTSIVFWLLAITAFALGVAVRRRDAISREWVLPVAVVLSTLPHAALVWAGDSMGMVRHAVPVATFVRLGLILLVLAVVDGLIHAANTHRPALPARS